MKIETNERTSKSPGLSDAEVAESRRLHGENMLTPPPRASLWKLYLDKYRDPIVQILLVAAAISLVLAIIENEYIETVGIILAVLLATTIGFVFERDAARRFDVLNSMGEEEPVKVRRNGKVITIRRRDVVVGDVLLLEPGDEVAADGRLLMAIDLLVDESSLTGEQMAEKSMSHDQSPKPNAKSEAAYPADVVLRSSMVLGGRAEAVVTAVGDSTEIGHVARKSMEVTGTKTPLNRQLDRLAKLISKVGSAVAILAFVVFLTRDILTSDVWHGNDYIAMAEHVLRYFMMAVTLIVMAVPEGLPMAVTLALALNMRRMLKSNILVRKLHACETMGAVTVICTDKTGTLTQNRMTVSEVEKEGDYWDLALALNSTAELNDEEGIGSPTEVALLRWLREKGIDYRELRQKYHIVNQIPFSTELKYMATEVEVDGKKMTFIKGAPEIVLGFCDMTDAEKQRILHQLSDWQSRGMRTLAFAIGKPLREKEILNAQEKNNSQFSIFNFQFKFQGIVAINDPIREDVPAAVEQCRKAGIEVKIVTGDTSATAIEIARQIGIDASAEGAHITGTDFSALSDDEALALCGSLKVMSRARPTDKQRLVQLLQRRGEVVAVTGDGTNDAPALNYAHVGLSLGSGTRVAKEASDITLMDDSFHSIGQGVMWGRSLYRNIQRFLFFQLVVNVAALLLELVGSCVRSEMPLTVTQILWVNLIMDTFAAMALASLPPSREVMKDKPRNQQEFIITKPIAKAIAAWGLFFAVLMSALWIALYFRGTDEVDKTEVTIFFTVFVMLQFWNLFNAKSLLSNHSAFRYLWRDSAFLFVLLLIFVGQVLIVQFGGEMFRTRPLSLDIWLQIIVVTFPVLLIGELWRWYKRKREN